jgi:Asp-tRNA(Asn)/Glu-tRNA(Gln) amidotransferase A subunit family amidase
MNDPVGVFCRYVDLRIQGASEEPLTGIPQVTLPLSRYQDCPMGISLLALAGKDMQLPACVAAGSAL